MVEIVGGPTQKRTESYGIFDLLVRGAHQSDEMFAVVDNMLVISVGNLWRFHVHSSVC